MSKEEASVNKLKTNLLVIFLGLSLLLGYFSLIIGSLWGYFLAHFYSKKEKKFSKFLKPVFIKIRSYQIHLHHWLWPSGLMALGFLLKISLICHPFSMGLLLGLIYQDINCDPYWKRIIIKCQK